MSTMNADELLQAVIADPDSDLPRLVYADWCEENGNLDRAEFIRAQCALARLPEWDPRCVGLRIAERRLLAEHGDRWRAELPALRGVKWMGFERGFVAEMATSYGFDLDVLREHGERIAAAAPLRTLTLSADLSWREMADWPRMPWLRHLRITEWGYVDMDMGAFSRHPLLNGLEALTLSDRYLQNAGAQALANCRGLRDLKRLDVSLNFIEDEGLLPLARSEHLTALRQLVLIGGRYTDYDPIARVTRSGFVALARSPLMARLEELNVSHNLIDRWGLEALLRSPAANLKRLGLGGAAPHHSRAFAAASPRLRLEQLDLSSTVHRAGDFDAMLGSPAVADLKMLDLSFCDLPKRWFEYLAQSQVGQSLCVLRLSGCQLLTNHWRVYRPRVTCIRRYDGRTEYHSADEWHGLDLPRLHTLDLSRCRISDKAAAELAHWPGLARLLSLNLSRCSLSAAGLRLLATSPHWGALLELDLSGNWIERLADVLAGTFLGSGKVAVKLEE